MTRDRLLSLLRELERPVPTKDGWGYKTKECAICQMITGHQDHCELKAAINWLEDEGNVHKDGWTTPWLELNIN